MVIMKGPFICPACETSGASSHEISICPNCGSKYIKAPPPYQKYIVGMRADETFETFIYMTDEEARILERIFADFNSKAGKYVCGTPYIELKRKELQM